MIRQLKIVDGELVRKVRERRGLSVTRLARRAGLNPPVLLRLEKTGRGRLSTIEKLAQALDIPIDLLVVDDAPLLPGKVRFDKDRLSEALEGKNRSATALEAGLSHQTVYNMLNPALDSAARAETIDKLCRALGISPADIGVDADALEKALANSQAAV
jgi:DNA-binding Xre family transcriptional regulator